MPNDDLRTDWAEGDTVHSSDINDIDEQINEDTDDIAGLTAEVADDDADIAGLTASVNSLMMQRQPAGQLCTLSRSMSNAVTITGGDLNLTYFRAPAALNFSHIGINSGDTAASGLTLAKFGIYSVDDTGDLTRIATTANLTSGILNGTFSAYQTALAAGAALEPDHAYAYGFVINASTMPSLIGSYVLDDANIDPRLCGLVTGQTDLPASIDASDIDHNYRVFYARLF